MNSINETRKRKLAELSLVFGVPIFTKAKENSRLAGLQRKLQKVVMPDLLFMQMHKVPDTEVHTVNRRIETWLKSIGWWDNPTHITEVVSFCMDVIEESPFTYHPKILETLRLLAEHLEKGKEFHHPTMEERDRLLDSWEAVYA